MFGFYEKLPYMLFDENVDINVYRRFCETRIVLGGNVDINVYRPFCETRSKTVFIKECCWVLSGFLLAESVGIS